MTSSVTIRPVERVTGTIRPPGSKSITNRALICAALAEGRSTLRGALDSEDTRVMIEALHRLAIQVEAEEAGQTLSVQGCGGKLPTGSAELFVGNSGTTIRFLTAVATLGRGRIRLDGVERMRQRPIGDLLAGLNQLGAETRSELDSNCPPVIVDAHGLRGGTARIRGAVSSQFLSGLLLAIPCGAEDTVLNVEGPLVSVPYVEMTVAVMESFGVHVNRDNLDTFRIAAPQLYRGSEYEIEPDASAASYFWAAAAITGGEVTVTGLTRDALQGDIGFCDCLQQMGCDIYEEPHGITVRGGSLHGITTDMNAISDTVQTLAAVALFADSPTTITGVAHIRHKETDRIGDLARELRKFGAGVVELNDGLRIEPIGTTEMRGPTIDTYDDHRMAMSLALPGLRVPDVVINDPGCTAKTYPGYFADLATLTCPPDDR